MSFKASGLRSHQCQSLDIRCQTKGPQFDNCNNCDMSKNIDINPRNFITNAIENTTRADTMEFEVDTAGDIFGDYDDYIPGEFGMDYLDSNVSDDESKGAIDEEEFILTNDSEILEPERLPPPNSFLSPLPDDLTPDEAVLKASRLRGGAEEVLQKWPFVVKFMKGKAGAIYANQKVDGNNLNTSYKHNIANAENPYSPFSSKMEWEIACWAKMRRPSSTAFKELIAIKGVSKYYLTVAHTLS